MSKSDFLTFFRVQRTYCSYCLMTPFKVEYCPGCKYNRRRRGMLDKFMPTREYLELIDKYLERRDEDEVHK